jgi:YD repeat-containing protein
MTRRIILVAAAWLVPVSAGTYTYDSSGRLALVDYGNGVTIAYAYDNAGNLLSRTVTTPARASQSTDTKGQPAHSKDLKENAGQNSGAKGSESLSCSL